MKRQTRRNTIGTRTVLITGAARRIGRACALSLAAAGWDIALHYHTSIREAETLAQLVRGMGRKAHLIAVDLREEKALREVFPSLARKGVAVDCLINSAARFEKDTPATFTAESWQAHMQVNLLAPLQLAQQFAGHYRGKQGNIISITDGLAGWSMSPAFFSYAQSKQGLEDATRLLALELAPHIRVNAIAPGATLEGKQDKKDTFAKLRKIIPLKRTSSPEEICTAVHFILSSPSLTGQILYLSGGMHLRG